MSQTMVPPELSQMPQVIVPAPIQEQLSPSNIISHQNSSDNSPSPTRVVDYTAHKKEVIPQHQDSVLKVDRNCLNCSGNMTHTIRAIKTACLMYTQGKIPYQDKEYHVDDVLDIKASVVAQCQRLVRENVFGTVESAGTSIRDLESDKAFIIEPLLEAKPTTAGQTQQQRVVLNIQQHSQVPTSSAKKRADSQPRAKISVTEINYQDSNLIEQNQETLHSQQSPKASIREPQLSMMSTVRHEEGSQLLKQDFQTTIASAKNSQFSSGRFSAGGHNFHTALNQTLDFSRTQMPAIGQPSLPIKDTELKNSYKSHERQKELRDRKGRAIQRIGHSGDRGSHDYMAKQQKKSTQQMIKEFQTKRSQEPKRPQTQMSETRIKTTL